MVKSVFISSTSLDLKKYRQAAIEACVSLGFMPIAMENFEAMGVGATEGSKRKLKEADLYVGIIAHRYGYMEAGYDKSVTEIEFDYAGERGLDRLCFIVDPAHTWPKKAYDRRNAKRLDDFKAKVDKSVIRSLYTTVEDFREKLVQALVNWQEWRSARSGELDAILATTPDDVPSRPEKLIGRDAMVAEINGLLDKGKRVLLQGFGGMGKTALAAAVTSQRIESGKGAAIWLRAGTEDLDGLMIALARPFNAQHSVTKETGSANRARVVRLLLAEHRVKLVVLDDAWNAKALTQILNVNAIPSGVPILVTSRSRSTGLTRLDVGRLERSSSLELLCHYGEPEWMTLKEANDLCEKLGDHTYAVRVAGLTLALDGLTPGELLDRIAAAPWKLAAPEGSEEEGRTSVEELLNTSLYGLDPEARMVFLAMGAFFTASATPEMLSLYMNLEINLIEDALNRLQRRGLAERVAETEERVSEYRTHDLAYSYARSQATPDDHHRALDCCLTYLGRYREPTPRNFAALRTELDNFLGAANWAITVERYSDVQRFSDWLYGNFDADTSDGYQHLQGYAGIATTLLSQAATASESLGQKAEQAAYLGSLGSAYRELGQVKTGMKHYRQALKLYRDLNDVTGEGITLGRLGIAYRMMGQVEPAIEHLEQALAIARQNKDPQAESVNLANLGIVYRRSGQTARALDYLEQALKLARERGDQRGEAINLGNIGDIYSDMKRVDEAVQYYERALAMARASGDKRGDGINLGRLGNAYRTQGQYERATDYLEQALKIAQETGDKRAQAINHSRLGNIHRDQSDVSEAVRQHERALEIARQIDDKPGEAYGQYDLGLDYLQLQDYRRALSYLQDAKTIFESLGMKQRAEDLTARIGEAKKALGS